MFKDDPTARRHLAARPALAALLPVVIATASLSACGGGGGGGGDALASCRAEAAQIGIDFEFYQSIGGCLPEDENGDASIPPPVAQGPNGPDEPDEPEVPVPALADFPATVAFDASFADVAGSNFYAGTPNTALLQGPPVVADELVGDAVTRPVRFAVGRTDPGLALRYLGVPLEGDGSADLFAVVENTGPERRCFVDLDGLVALDTNGEALEVFGLGGAFVDGGLTRVLGITVGGCLEAGSKGHARFAVGAPAADIGAVFVTELTSNPSTDPGPGALVEAVSYDVVGSDLEVTVANRGATDVDVTRVTVYLLDAEGRAVAEGLVGGLDDPLAPGAEGVADLSIGSLDLTGRVTTVRVILEYRTDDE